MSKVKATVFIPTYNGDKYLDSVLNSVFKQKFGSPFEVLIIDSGSTDKTLEIIKRFPGVQLHQIPNSEFGHGKTRNKAAKLANGEFIVYLSQDAVPANPNWLDYMLEPFNLSDRVFCVFGKQIPRPFSDATTKREVSSVFDSLGQDYSLVVHRKKSISTNKEIKPFLTFFSDVNSAVRRSYLLEKIPYRDVRYSEDQLLGKDILDAGYIKVYTPLGTVFHSNEYRLWDYFYRKFDENLGIYETLGIAQSPRFLSHLKRTIVDMIKDFVFIWQDKDYSSLAKVRNMISSCIRNPLKEYAGYLVANEKSRNKIGLKHSLEARKK